MNNAIKLNIFFSNVNAWPLNIIIGENRANIIIPYIRTLQLQTFANYRPNSPSLRAFVFVLISQKHVKTLEYKITCVSFGSFAPLKSHLIFRKIRLITLHPRNFWWRDATGFPNPENVRPKLNDPQLIPPGAGHSYRAYIREYPHPNIHGHCSVSDIPE